MAAIDDGDDQGVPFSSSFICPRGKNSYKRALKGQGRRVSDLEMSGAYKLGG